MGSLNLPFLGQVVDGFFGDFGVERSFLLEPGSNSRMERGSSNAPERQCWPTSRAFSST